MVFVNDVFQADVGDVGVDLGGVDVGVSEHELYGLSLDHKSRRQLYSV